MPTSASTVAALLAQGVIPVIRTRSAATARRAVEWLMGAEYRVFEVTMTIPGALDLVSELSTWPEIIVGAGTVLNAATARELMDAGARFLVSPCGIGEIADAARDRDVPALLGALTPTEVWHAWQAGAPIVKLFPAATVGPGHLKALASVFPQVPMMPTGGIDADNLREWINAGAACVGVGGKLLDNAALERGGRAEIVAAGTQLRAAWGAMRSAAVSSPP